MQRNVVYGMYSGLALLMDVFEPDEPNGFGVVFIPGSGWSAPLSLDATPLKDRGQQHVFAVPMAEAGYTTFVINHRAAPRFGYPDPVEDAQRAVRFVRHSADEFGIRCDRIGAVGGSSGGHLSLMLGYMPADGAPESDDPILRESANVQCVVARAAPSNFLSGNMSRYWFLRCKEPEEGDETSAEYRIHREASPITYLTASAPPTLLIHGDADPVVPVSQSKELFEALQKKDVASDLIIIPGGGHGAVFEAAIEPVPDYVGRTIAWLDEHLKD